MTNHKVKCSNFEIANDKPFTLIAGPCQLENEQHAIKMSTELKKITSELGINLIYKTSFDKANRTSLKGKRGIGLEKSLPIFDKIRKEVGLPVLTDVHTAEQCSIVADHVDVLQIPAFLCRQTDLLIAAAKTGKVINVNKLVKQRDELMKAKTLKQIKKLAPWYSDKQVEIFEGKNPDKIPSSVGLPPYHARCRTRTVVE